MNASKCITFAGCGFLGIYHLGVVKMLLERNHLQTFGAYCGASSGSLIAAQSVLGWSNSILQVENMCFTQIIVLV